MITKTACVDVDIDMEDIDFHDILDYISNCNEDEKSQIIDCVKNGTKRYMSTITVTDIDVDVDVDIEDDDVIEYMLDCSDKIKTKIFNEIKKPSSLYDELKHRLISEALKKYDLDELEKRLDIKYY
jgi:hypothetical protein